MAKRKILFYSTHDWSNSGHRLCAAINRHSTRYSIDYFVMEQHPFGYNRGPGCLTSLVNGQVYENHDAITRMHFAAKHADILHFKEDEGIPRSVAGVPFDLTRPVVHHFCGSVWRSHWEAIWPSMAEYVNRVIITTPDLRMPGVGGVTIPFAFDETRYRPIPRDDSRIFIGHIPSNESRKGSPVIREACERIRDEFPAASLSFLNKVPSDTALRYKQLNDIYIDQINDIGTYGNAAVESMMFGSATLCSMSTDRCGIVSVTPETLYDVLAKLVTDRDALLQAQELAYSRFLRLHSYPAVCAAIEKVYDEV